MVIRSPSHSRRKSAIKADKKSKEVAKVTSKYDSDGVSDGVSVDASENEEDEDENIPCVFCKSADRPDESLLCDKCDACYHTFCLTPVLKEIPEGDWFCPKCVAPAVSAKTGE